MVLYKSSKALYIGVCALAMFVLLTMNVKAQPNCVEMMLVDTISCEPLVSTTIVINDPIFNVCPITVAYTTRKCIIPDPNCPGGTRETMAVTIGGFTWDNSEFGPCWNFNRFIYHPD